MKMRNIKSDASRPENHGINFWWPNVIIVTLYQWVKIRSKFDVNNSGCSIFNKWKIWGFFFLFKETWWSIHKSMIDQILNYYMISTYSISLIKRWTFEKLWCSKIWLKGITNKIIHYWVSLPLHSHASAGEC